MKDPKTGEVEKLKAPTDAQADGLLCTWALEKPWCVCVLLGLMFNVLTFSLESTAFTGNIIRVTPYYTYHFLRFLSYKKKVDKFQFDARDAVEFYRQLLDKPGCK